MAYMEWLTVSLEVELRRLKEELSRSLSRLDTRLTEYNEKYKRLSASVKRIRYWEGRIRLAEQEVERARKKTRARLRAAQDELATRRARITPYLAEREKIIGDINFERDTLLRPLQSRIRYLKEQIRLIEEELERRKRPPPKKQLVHVKIIVYSIARGKGQRKYDKRFQAFYNVDAIRDKETGVIDYSAKLTQNEIDACIEIFYTFWDWATLPPSVSKPKWIEAGEWETTDEPRGADVKQLSVRAEEKEIYSKRFRPPDPVYTPSKKESEEIMRLVG